MKNSVETKIIQNLRTWHLFASLPLFIFLTGCLTAGVPELVPDIRDRFSPKVLFLVPAKNAEAGTVKSVLIVSDSQTVSQQIAMDFETQMNRLRIEERPHFSKVKLVPRFNDLASELKLNQMAKQHGVEAVLVISDGKTQVNQDSRTEERISCAVTTQKLFAICPKGSLRTSKVSCRKTVNSATFRLRMYRPVDGRFVVIDTISGQSVNDRCSDDESSYPDNNQLEYAAVLDASAQAMRILAPSYQMGPLDIMTSDAGIHAQQKPAFNAAVKFANAKRTDEACSRFQELYQDNKESPVLTFNVAFCYELVGDMLRANQAYKRASELVNRPNSQIDRRLAITEKALRDNPAAVLTRKVDNIEPTSQVLGGLAGSKRVALVIGNARYQRSALVNPVNDARLVGDHLKRIGFDVVTLENLGASRFESSVRDFASRAKNADVALFYYAGHAIQSDGENYLMPVDNGKMRTVEDVRNGGSVQLASVLAMLDVAEPVVRMVVIDACRDNPLPAANRSLAGGGLAPITSAPRGGLIAYATAPGKTAEDGVGRNSTFSKHFAAQLTVPNLTIEQIFKRVREAVKAETKNRQEPIETSNLIGDVFLVQADRK